MTARVILTVDDDKTVLDSLKSQLKAMFGTRFQYEMAESAHEAWEVIEVASTNFEKIILELLRGRLRP